MIIYHSNNGQGIFNDFIMEMIMRNQNKPIQLEFNLKDSLIDI